MDFSANDNIDVVRYLSPGAPSLPFPPTLLIFALYPHTRARAHMHIYGRVIFKRPRCHTSRLTDVSSGYSVQKAQAAPLARVLCQSGPVVEPMRGHLQGLAILYWLICMT